MRQIGFALAMLATAICLATPTWASDTVKSRITAMRPGTILEVRLTDHTKVRGALGAVTESSFALTDPTGEHRYSFDGVAGVKRIGGKSHMTRNVWIGVGIGVAAVGITAGLIARCAPFGCNPHL